MQFRTVADSAEDRHKSRLPRATFNDRLPVGTPSLLPDSESETNQNQMLFNKAGYSPTTQRDTQKGKDNQVYGSIARSTR